MLIPVHQVVFFTDEQKKKQITKQCSFIWDWMCLTYCNNAFLLFFVFQLVKLFSYLSCPPSDRPIKFTERPRPGIQTVCSSFSPGQCLLSSLVLSFAMALWTCRLLCEDPHLKSKGNYYDINFNFFQCVILPRRDVLSNRKYWWCNSNILPGKRDSREDIRASRAHGRIPK